MKKPHLTIGDVYKAKKDDLDLDLVAGEGGLHNPVLVSALNRPGLALAGFYDVFARRRIQVIGLTEISFLQSLEPDKRRHRLEHLFSYKFPGFIVTTDQEVLPEIIKIGTANNIPIFKTSFETTRFCSFLSVYLDREFAPTCTMHGTMMEIFGMGVLLIGKSGVGKSECALELVKRGHRLIVDDMVKLTCLNKDAVIATASGELGYHMEIRGIGIIDIQKMYGIGSVRRQQEVDMLIKLELWEEEKAYEREGLEQKYQRILEVRVPTYTIPVVPGRNLSILVETAALHRRLLSMGINPAKALNEKIIDIMRQECRVYDDLVSQPPVEQGDED